MMNNDTLQAADRKPGMGVTHPWKLGATLIVFCIPWWIGAFTIGRWVIQWSR